MTILLLNQTFHPDDAATAQYAADLVRALARRGHQVTVLAGRRAYGRPEVVYPAEEKWEGIRIHRVGVVDFGKQARWRRALNFASFLGAAAWRLAWMPRFDVTIAMTTPPLISVLGALFTRFKGGKLRLWIMDLNPDEAVAAGWLRERAPVTRALEWLLRWSLRRADTIIVLDRFMKERVEAKLQFGDRLRFEQETVRRCPRREIGDSPSRIVVIPPGARDHWVRYDEAGRREFRRKFALAGKFVVMYSGNHSPCHPLDTLLAAADRLRDDPRFAFCFIGGGSQFETVRRFAGARCLDNIVCAPYQPEERLAASLSAADLHVVVMGDQFVGIVHPSKIYNILALGIPVLYIGPAESHITDLAYGAAAGTGSGVPRASLGTGAESGSMEGQSASVHSALLRNTGDSPGRCAERPGPVPWFFAARHGEVERVVRNILAAEDAAPQGDPGELEVAARFSHQAVIAKLCACVDHRRREFAPPVSRPTLANWNKQVGNRNEL